MNKQVMFDETSRTIRTTRVHAPLHFVWKIDCYSTLLESKWEKIESGAFEVDGRKWKLTFYPNGDNKRKGEGYISLYLSVLDTEEELPLSWDLFLKFQFLVFDHVNNKYLAIQDVHEVCHFQRMKTEWGFARLLPLDVFKEPSNGYLLDDSCVFGVDIFVVKGGTRGDTFSVVKPLTIDKSYSFKIENFSTIVKRFVESDVFTIQDMKWKLQLYPKGDQKAKDNVSLFLHLDFKLPVHNKVYAKYKLRLIDQVHAKHLERTVDYGFQDKVGIGYPRFALQKDVHDASKGYLVKDTIIVEVEIDYLSIVKHFS
ncbi:hypothetical protein ACFE04_010488 [Oxalis oulophora]